MTTQPESAKDLAPSVASPPTNSRRAGARPPWAQALVAAVAAAALVTGCGGTSKPTSAAIAPTIPVTDAAAVDQSSPAADESSGTDATDASGTEATDAADASGTDAAACKLVSESDVTTAMKQPMAVSGGAGAAICTYSANSDPSVVLAVQTFATPEDASLDLSVEDLSDHVDGLGDDAFWNSTLDMVFVKKGERSFALTSPSLANLTGDPQASEAAMVTLAKIALSNF